MKVIDIINAAQAEGRTRLSVEILPPRKGEGTEGIFAAIDRLTPFDPAYIDVTFHRENVKYVEHASGLLERRVVRRRPGTVGISAAIKARYGIETVPHLICGGLSRYDVEDMLIDMDFLGLHNVLALRGDNLRGDNQFRPAAGGHAHADELVAQIAAMNRGAMVDGEVERCRSTEFCVGVAGYPEKHSEAPNMKGDISFLRQKVDAGASYVVTQMCFDSGKILGFIDRCREAGIDVPIIPGIKPLSTKAQLTLLPQVFSVELPEELVSEVERCRDNAAVVEVGIEWAVAQARELKKAGLPILHFYIMSRGDIMAKIAKEVF
ncbi:MAG: methylenetetrahydrofolate reductase [Rikenellaceae bacterium]|jgi:methylenetetrahydrofolate reductase (NADPH)|nr:methylenetetrahydrofolate reductase [Rikenellaceae bacterium]